MEPQLISTLALSSLGAEPTVALAEKVFDIGAHDSSPVEIKGVGEMVNRDPPQGLSGRIKSSQLLPLCNSHPYRNTVVRKAISIRVQIGQSAGAAEDLMTLPSCSGTQRPFSPS